MSNRKFSASDWNARHFRRVEDYVHQIELIYLSALREATQIAVSLKIDPNKSFSFSDYPQTSERVRNLIQRMALNLISAIGIGTQTQWEFANQKNDALVGFVLGKTALSRAAVSRYMSRNLEALAAFQTRKANGLGLSERVWKYTNQFRSEIELGLDIGLGEGKSAAQISQDMRGYLNNPDTLFRRVRSKRGNLVLSKAASQFHPGTGTYRSSYKNAMRLARTEINDAYRSADFERWQKLDFVVGIRVKRSNNPYPCDLCESLAGTYPKDFKFRGNHPNCRCVAISILATRDELQRLTRMLINEEDTSGFQSVNQVTDVHEGYKEWIEKNKSRLLSAKNLPYFMTDNPAYSQGIIR